MTTAAENERLAVLEIEVKALKGDVTEIKGDVKGLIVTVNSLVTQGAARVAVDEAISQSRSSTGVWVRTFLPWLIAVAGFLMMFAHVIFHVGE